MTKNKKNPSISKTDSKKSKNKSKDSQNKTSDKKNTRSTSEKTNNSEDIKTRKTINVSIPKKNSNKLNSLFKNWDDESLNLSNEVCKCILFKDELENNPITQPLISTLNLIKMTLKNKNLSEDAYNKELANALNSIISITINTQELWNLVENKLYSSSDTKTENSSNNYKHNSNNSKNSITKYDDEVIPTNNTLNSDSNEHINDTIAITQEKTTTNVTPSNDNECITKSVNDIIRWDNIPEKPTVSNDKKDKNISDIELLNKRLTAFSYPTN